MTEKMLTVGEFAAIFRISKMTVYRMIERKELICVRLSERSIRIPESEVDIYINGRKS
jgi:excisionase family DNA binding protein